MIVPNKWENKIDVPNHQPVPIQQPFGVYEFGGFTLTIYHDKTSIWEWFIQTIYGDFLNHSKVDRLTYPMPHS